VTASRPTSSRALLVDYATQKGANVIVRGSAAVADFEYEFQMTMMNRHLHGEIETIFMMTGESHFYTSSRLVKEVVGLGGNVAGLVPDVVLPKLLAARRRSVHEDDLVRTRRPVGRSAAGAGDLRCCAARARARRGGRARLRRG
jgi:hypothetical protein